MWSFVSFPSIFLLFVFYVATVFSNLQFPCLSISGARLQVYGTVPGFLFHFLLSAFSLLLFLVVTRQLLCLQPSHRHHAQGGSRRHIQLPLKSTADAKASSSVGRVATVPWSPLSLHIPLALELSQCKHDPPPGFCPLTKPQYKP